MTIIVYVILLHVMMDGIPGQISTPTLYATKCRGNNLELHCVIPDHVIHVIDVYLGEGPGRFSGCNLEEGDCFTHYEGFHEDVMEGCHHQHGCSRIRVPDVYGYCDNDPDDEHRFDYGVVEYRCIYESSSRNNDYFFWACNDKIVDFELCPGPNRSISDIHILLYESCYPEYSDCFNLYNETSAGYTGPIFEKCSGKRACTDLVVESEAMECEGGEAASDFTYISYRCSEDSTMIEASRRYSDMFDDVTCGPESIIHVINGFYGDIGGEGLGSYEDISIFDCRVNVDADYMKKITGSCDGQQSCGDLRAQRSSDTYCNPDGWPNEYSEYVTIVYRCVDIPVRETSTENPSTQTDISYTAALPTETSPNTPPNTGLVVGVVVGVTLVTAAVVLVVVFVVRKKRKRKNPQPQPTTLAYPNAIYDQYPDRHDNTSPVSAPGHGNGAVLGQQAANIDPPEYSLATAVDEYSVVDKSKKHQRGGHTVQNGPGEKHGPREDNKKIRDNTHGQGHQTERTKNGTPNAEQNVSYVNYNQMSKREASGEDDSQVELNSADLVLVDNANYGTGPLKDKAHSTTDEYSTVDNRDTRKPEGLDDTDLVLVDNANYGSSLQVYSNDAYNAVNEGGPTRNGTTGSGYTGRPEEVDDTELVIVDNASCGGILLGDSSDVYSAVQEGVHIRNHGTGPEIADTDFEVMDNPNYA